jgi:hypothetical protein
LLKRVRLGFGRHVAIRSGAIEALLMRSDAWVGISATLSALQENGKKSERCLLRKALA